MNNKPNYYITGGAGFIGSCLVSFLNSKGITPIVMERLDDIGDKWKNLSGLQFILQDITGKYTESSHNSDSAFGNPNDFLIHLGANVITTEKFSKNLWDNNFYFSHRLFRCFGGRIIYASSASVYGMEEKDFSESGWGYKPSNPYAFTKYELDKSIFYKENAYLDKNKICALRFFNVYGSGAEAHKGNMSSVIFKWLNDDKLGKCIGGNYFCEEPREELKKLELFKSLNPAYADGEQNRDFIYVGDICKVIWHITKTEPFYNVIKEKDSIHSNFRSGIFNVGSGTSTTWNTVAKNVLSVRGLSDSLIEYVEMPDNLKKQYQYSTKADLTKLRGVLGYKEQMTTIEDGIKLTWEQLNK